MKYVNLVFSEKDELEVNGYSDSIFQPYENNSYSQSGWVFISNGGAVTWKISKQHMVAGSTCESEYTTTSKVTKETT